jgi:hypothetical protein
MIKSVEFRQKRDKSWKKLESLLTRVEKHGFSDLSPLELEELGSLYRMAASSLQVVRTISLDQSVHHYLESLVMRAFFVIYATSPKQTNPIGNFILRQFPQLVRKYFLHHFVAFVMMLLGCIAGFWATLADPVNYFAFVDKAHAQGRTPFTSRENLQKVLESGRNLSDAEKTYFFSFLFSFYW